VSKQGSAPKSSSLEVHFFKSLQQQIIGIDIFDKVWKASTGTELTVNFSQAMVHSGSYFAGALIGSKCVGAAFAFPATTGGYTFTRI
jgi:predicted GNAT superfamily acetyltransferase